MKRLTKKVLIDIPAEKAFQNFVHAFNEWWPKEYTWSQQKLVKINIEPKKNGLCTETGPYGFRCDWGRVTEYTENQKIGLKWQISPNREPIPNPENASDIEIIFLSNEKATTVTLKHFNFDKHGEGGENYCSMMDSEYGWKYILKCFKDFCEKEL